MEYLMVGAGGALGAIARYSIGKWVGRRWILSFPAATFGINILGCFVLGFLYIVFSEKTGIAGGPLKPFATTGLLGAFTTYSTFSLEIVNLLEDRQVTTAIAYFLASLAGGLAAGYAGILLGQLFVMG